MAKTYLAGEAAVRLIPNSKNFHHKARQELAADKTLHHPVSLKPDATGFRKEAKERIKAVKLSVDVKPLLDVTGFRKESQAKLDAGRPLKVKVAIEAHADKKSVRLAREVMQAQIDAMGPLKIRVEADHAAATTQMAAWRAYQESRVLTVKVRADTTAASGAMKMLGMGGGRGGRSSLRKAAIGTGITVAPIVTNAAVGGLSALTGAASQAIGTLGLLPAAATAAGAGLAGLAIGVVGVAGAFQALAKEAQDTSAADNGNKAAAAARNVASAERGLRKAQDGVRQAQDDLNKARLTAVRRLRDMNDELRLAPLNEKEAALAIKEAMKRLSEAYASGDSLEIEGAQIDVEKSKIQYDILKKQNQDLYNDTMAANKAGIEGDEQVVAAKQGIVDANDAVLDSQDQLTAALEAQTEALTSTSAAADEAAKAMAKLSPNAQAFVLAMRALGPEWTELRKAVQDRLFAGLGDDVTTLAKAQLPGLRAGLEGINILLNRGMRDSLAVFSSPDAVRDFNTTLGNTQLLFAGLADTAKPLSQAWIDIVTVGSTFMPRLGQWIASNAQEFGAWIAEMRESGKMEEFFNKSIEMAKQLGRIISNVAHVLGDFFSAGAETGGGFLNTIETATATLRAFTESTEGQTAMREFFAGVAEAVRTLAPILTIVAKTVFDTLGPALTDLVIAAGPGLVTMFEGLRTGLQAIAPIMPVVGEAIGTVFQALGSVFEVLGPVIADTLAALAPALMPLAELLGTIIIALAPILPLLAQFVGLLIQALAPALTKVVEALTPVIASLVEAFMPVLPPLMDVLGQVAGIIADALVMALEALAPFLPMIIELWGQLITAMMPLLPVIVNLAMSIIPPLIRALEGILPTVLRVIGILVQVVNYIVPVLIPVLNLLSAVVGEVFSWIGSFIGGTFRNVIDPIFSAIGWGLEKLGDFFNWLWHDIIVPAWDGIGKALSWAWDNVIQPVWTGMQNGLDTLGRWFHNTVEGIKTVWAGLRKAAAVPIVWILENVVNGALKTGWNALAKILPGVDEWDGVDVGPIKSAIEGTPGYATGGYVRGPGGPTDDAIDARLSNGEFVMRAEAVKRIGVDKLNQMNQGNGYEPGYSRDGKPKYADGGTVQGGAELTTAIQRSMWDAVRTAFPGAVLTSGTRYQDVGSGYDFHMAGQAIDLGGPMQQMADWIAGTYPNALELFWDPGPNIDEGRPTGAIGGHSDHVHWAMSEMVGSDGKLVSADTGSSGGGGGGAFGWLRRKFADSVANLLEKPLNAIEGIIPEFGPSMLGQLPKTWYRHIKDSALSFIREKIGGATASDNANPGTGPAADQVREAFKAYGWDSGAQWDAADWIIGKESSWNPVARNPSSGAFGLFQFLGSTKDQYLPDENPNPGIQGAAGARYIRDRYGDPLAAKAFWEQNGWYDEGGIANGKGLMLKNVLEPERVLSPGQTVAFEALAPFLGQLLPALKGFAGTGPADVNVEQVNGKDLKGADMPVTADIEGRDVTTGVIYGQPLQGAAIDNQTGEYLPGNNTAGVDYTVDTPFFTATPEWKTAKSFGSVFGLSNNFDKVEQKANVLNEIGNAAKGAAPAWIAALEGNPVPLTEQIGTASEAWRQKTSTDFSNFLPENAGGILESALSGLSAPLIGTVHTGMSQAQLVETMEDVENRKARRSKTGRSRRG
ncbi:tape measure protein [Rhodococcus phage MacGully]|nr:tape measure protein [Rhodococcus phage MacGully]